MSSPEETIVAQKLTRKFGRHTAIHELNFSIAKGEIVGFLGPNGAGKSTTLRMLTGLLPATSGKLSICGIPVARYPDSIKGKVGYMPENNPLPEDLRVIEYLRFRAAIKGIPYRLRKARIEHAMEVCELQHRARRQIIGTLSKGFRQRVGIADAILAAPPITVLDEPTIGLDPHQILSIRRLLDNLRGETTVIFSSHILSEVEITCDRVLILNQGHLVAQGTSAQLRREFQPGSRYHVAWKGSMDLLEQALVDFDTKWQATAAKEATDSTATLIHPDPDVDGGPLLEFLFRRRLKIVAFHRIEPNLEEIFLTATRRSWDTPSSDAPVMTSGSES